MQLQQWWCCGHWAEGTLGVGQSFKQGMGCSASTHWPGLWPFSSVCTGLLYCFPLLAEMCKVKDTVLPPRLATRPTFPYFRNSSRDSHVPVDTNPNKEWVLPLPFSLFPYQSLFPSPKVHDIKLIFFWAKACFSYTWPWLLSLCSFLKAGLCITDPEWGLTYSYICLVFMLIEEVPLSRIFGLKPKEVWIGIVSTTFLYIYFHFYFRMYFYTEKWLKQ